MAKVYRDNKHLEREYSGTGSGKNKSKGWAVLILTLLYVAAVVWISRLGLLSPIVAIVTFVTYFIILVKILSNRSGSGTGSDNKEILAAGIEGELETGKVLSRLPDSYTVFQDVVVTYKGKDSEIDNVVVGPGGVFIVESKAYVGRVIGEMTAQDWVKFKDTPDGAVDRKTFYNPARQVGTHIYRLANYLRSNGADVYVRGIVYFSEPDCTLSISGVDSSVTIYSLASGGDEQMLADIRRYEPSLNADKIKKVCELMRQK